MDGVVTAGWIFDPEIVLVVAAECVIIEAAFRASNLETGENGLVRTAIVRQVASIQGDAVFGMNVDYAAGSETDGPSMGEWLLSRRTG